MKLSNLREGGSCRHGVSESFDSRVTERSLPYASSPPGAKVRRPASLPLNIASPTHVAGSSVCLPLESSAALGLGLGLAILLWKSLNAASRFEARS